MRFDWHWPADVWPTSWNADCTVLCKDGCASGEQTQ